MVNVLNMRRLESYDAKRLQRYALVDCLVKLGDTNKSDAGSERFQDDFEGFSPDRAQTKAAIHSLRKPKRNFRGVRRSVQRVYALKSPHGNKKRGENLERVVYRMTAVGGSYHRGAGGVVEKPSSRLIKGSLGAAYVACLVSLGDFLGE